MSTVFGGVKNTVSNRAIDRDVDPPMPCRPRTRALAWRSPFAMAVVCAVLFYPCLASPPSVAAGDDDVFAEIQKAIEAFQENRKEDGSAHLDKARALAKTFKPTCQTYLREARIWLYATKPANTAAAIKAAQNAIDLDPKAPEAAEAFYLLGLVAMQYEGNPTRAVDNFAKALELKKEPVAEKAAWPVDAANKLWYVLDRTNQFQLAKQLFKRLTVQEPANANYYWFLGLAHSKCADHLGAIQAFAEAVNLRPDDDQLHVYYVESFKKSPGGLTHAAQAYEELRKKHANPLILVMLADLYLELGNNDKALARLEEAKKAPSLEFRVHERLAKALAKAQNHAEAADQFARLWTTLPEAVSYGWKIDILIAYGKALVQAGQVEDGIRKLEEALKMHRMDPEIVRDQGQEPLDIFFELGLAHWELAKKDKTKGTGQAEIYFRKYLDQLKEGAKAQMRFAKDVQIAENLGILYMEGDQPKKAAEVFHQALKSIEYVVDKAKCPTSRVQWRYVEALHTAKDWTACIAVAKELVADKEYGLKTRLLLAQAYVENNQADKAIEQLGALKGTAQWNDDALLTMGQALVKSSPSRPTEALKYIEEAFRKDPTEEKRALEYARVLRHLNRLDEALELYQAILKKNQRSVQAMVGLGDLEMELAKGTSGRDSVDHYKKAVGHFADARMMEPTPEVLNSLVKAERGQAVAEAELQADNDRLRWILYTAGLILAAAIPIGYMVYVYRRQWAMHCFRQVCDLEADLVGLIRERVRTRWNGDWQHLGDEPFRGRLDYKTLRSRVEKQGAKDILAVANFGHLVAIVDGGWEALGFKELCSGEVADPKDLIVAHLSYVSSCRACLAHVGKLEELSSRHLGRDPQSDGTLKAQLPKHLHRQVKTSLKLIRSRINLRPQADDLPVLAPVRQAVNIRRAP
jgi:tetratricopeptide (TPR) repeat protein